MNGGGILLDDKDPPMVAATLDRVLTDEAFRGAVLRSQARTLAAAKAIDFGALLEKHIATALASSERRA